MPFKLKAFLPSKQREVQISELTYKQYRELVKSLHSTDKEESIQQYNSILTDLCPDIKDIDITFEDKLFLLYTVRNYCVSPDLKLKITTVDKNIFNYSLPVEEVLKKLKNVNKSGKIVYKDIEVSFSSYKARDEYVFIGNNKDTLLILASYIDTIKILDKITTFRDLTLKDRRQIVEAFPFALLKKLQQEISKIEDKFQQQNLILINNPLNKAPALKLTQNINYDILQKLINFGFTEELNNVYRAFYNIVRYAGFNPDYVDRITPIEMQVYWMYFMEDSKKESTETSKVNALQLPNSPDAKLGF